MKIEIDQSVKIEQTNRDTIIAFSNNSDGAVVIPAKAKKRIKDLFRAKKQPHMFYYKTFAAGVVLLIKYSKIKTDKITIDREYAGRERLIEKIILEMLKKLRCKELQIHFAEIGRKSNAHRVAYLTMKKKRKAETILTIKELEELVFE